MKRKSVKKGIAVALAATMTGGDSSRNRTGSSCGI